MDDNPSSQRNPDPVNPAARPSIEPRITEIARIGLVGLFAYWSFTLIAPFAIILIWAAILAVALYPAYAALSAILGQRPRVAALVITMLGLLVIVAPLAAIAFSFAEGLQVVLARLNDRSLLISAPPDSIRSFPLIGERIYSVWSMASDNLEAVLQQIDRKSVV